MPTRRTVDLFLFLRMPNRNITTCRAGNRPRDQQHIVLFVNPNDFEITNRHASIPVTTRHFCAFKNSGRIRTLSDRATVSMDPFYSVSCPLPGEVVSLHHAGKATTFAFADNVNSFQFGQRCNRHHAANFKTVVFTVRAEFTDEPFRFAIGLGSNFNSALSQSLLTTTIQGGNVTTLGTSCQSARLVVETDLHGLITVAILGSNLQHNTRTSLDHRHRCQSAVLVVNLSCSNLPAEHTHGHDGTLPS